MKHFLKDFRFLNLANPLTLNGKPDRKRAISPPIPGVASRGAWIMSKKWLVLLAVSAGAVALTACAKKEEAKSDAAVAVESAGEAIDDAVDATADAAGEVMDDAAAVTDDAMDAAGEAMDDAGAAVEGAVDDAGNMMDKAADEAGAMMDKAVDDAGAMMDKAEDAVEEATTDAPGQR